MEYGRLVVTVIKTLESGPKILVVFETAALALVGPIFYRPVQCYKHNQQRSEPGAGARRTRVEDGERHKRTKHINVFKKGLPRAF